MAENNEATTEATKAPAKRAARKAPAKITPEAYAKMTDKEKAALWNKLRNEQGQSYKTVRLQIGLGPSAGPREFKRLVAAGLVEDKLPARGRPANGASKPAAKKAPAKKATARKATPVKKATAKRTGGTIVSATKRAANAKAAS